MNHYFIAIYDGEFPTEKLHTILQSNPTFTDLNVRTLSISSPRPFTLLVAEEHDALTIELTDKYHLLTKELQTLEQQEKYYYVYDYKIRKTIENPTQKCFPFAQINISVTKFHQMIQKVKDLKRPVFAGYNIVSHDADILTIDVLLSSPLLDPNTSEKNTTEHAYLQQLTESISRSELCTSIKASSLI
ncbi:MULTISPECIES: hypothetical protein [unclassified Bacillus cereus group]|uniref:hypothetical protein n=1 Tax=Bacillus cereus group TaxID=86661 RepID=UPI001F5A9EFC|nr:MULTISPECIES: hypothetical protein [unclassified Bacillus cereus group]MDA2662292.1 hypothetical protein [Bacillus cereus group sp. Bc032]MDA2673015.1 hypothetical protein [Bacillus cereus group sp. Bc031]MDA2678336.1 hypothetical protein [Bacillus cereus group sp. Bc029]MDA2683845.1 hypothetical protein [Bacillus cereus group sp. Bc030]MDA2739428.1 hypothetical protein [Bacillus cereus group sp. Bc011]